MTSDPPQFWTRTSDHATLARSTCPSAGVSSGGRCGHPPAEILSELQPQNSIRSSGGFLLIDSCGTRLRPSCIAWHLHQQLTHLCPLGRSESTTNSSRPVSIPEEREDFQDEPVAPLTQMAVRCVGSTFDSIFISDLHRSLMNELRPNETLSQPAEEWSEMLRQLSDQVASTRLVLVIQDADRLRSTRTADSIWNTLNCVPSNIFLVATSQVNSSNSGPADCPLRIVQAEGSGTSVVSCGRSTQTLTELEQKFAADLISRTAALIDRTPLGVTEQELATCLRRMGLDDESIDQLPQLIQLLDPLLIRANSVRVCSGGGESLLFWDCPACQAAFRSRYQLGPDPIRQALIGRTEELRNVLRLLVHCLEHPVDLQTVWTVVFDWNIWRMLAQAGTFTFVQAIVRQASVSFVDSQVWIMERALDSIQRSMSQLCSSVHLAAQLVAHLKPFADEENHRDLYALYRGAWTFCEQSIDPVLVPVTTSLNYLASPLIRKGAECPGAIQLMAASPDARTVVTVIRGSTEPLLWRSTSAPGDGFVASLKGHSRPVTCLHVTADSRWLITGSEDLSVIIWDMQSATLFRRIREHIASVLCVTSTASPTRDDWTMIISGGEDSIIQVSSVESAVTVRNGTLADEASTGEGHDRVARIDHHRGPVTCAVINHRNDVLVSGSQDGHVCLWSVDDWSLLNVIHVGNPVGHVALSTDDVFLLIVGDEDGLPRLHSLTTGSLLRTWIDLPSKVTGAVVLGGNGHSIAALSASDGRILCCDCHSGQLIYVLPHGADQSAPAPIRCCAARGRDSRLLYHAVGKAVRIWMLTYEEKKPFSVQYKENQSHVTAVAMSPDGSVIVTGRNDGNVTLWRATSLSRMVEWNHRNAAITAVAFDAVAGAYVASAAEDGTAASRHLDTGKMLDPTTIHTSRVIQLEVLSDWSGSAVSCDVNGTLTQWRILTGEIIRHWQWVAGCSKILAATRNARFIAGSSGNHSVRLWSLEAQSSETPTDREVGQFTHSEEVLCLTLTSDSRYLITGSKDCSLKMWQLDDRKLVQVMAGHNDHVTAVACTPSASSSATAPSSPASQTKWLAVVSGSRDRQLIVWDAVTGSEIHTLNGHRSSINCLRVSGDGTVVASGSEDGVLRVWNIKLGVCLSTFSLGNAIQQIVTAQDMSRIVIRTSRPCPYLTVLDLLRTPAVLVKMSAVCDALPGPPGPSRPASPAGALPSLRKPLPSLRLLKKEISLDSYTWLKRYGRSNSQSSNSAHAAPLPASQQHATALDLQLHRRNSFCNVPETSEKS